MKILRKIYHFFTKTRLRKILSSILLTSMIATTIKFVFIKPKEARADSFIKLDEGYGATTNDQQGNISGTITNAVWKSEELCLDDKCLYFDGSGDFISFGDDTDLDFVAADDFTIEFWFRHPVIATNPDYAIAKHEVTVAGGYKVYMDSDGDIVFGVDDDGTWDTTDIVGDDQSRNYDDNAWHHVAAVKDGSPAAIYIYVDGELIDSDTSLAETGSLVNAANFYVGIDSDGASNGWEGFIDEVKVYRSLRSAGDIKADFIKGSPISGASTSFGMKNTSFLSDRLIGYWKMDETSGNATDSSGVGTTLTNNGTTTFTNSKFGNGANPNGSSQFFDAADNSTLSITGKLTLAAWILPDVVTGTHEIVGKFDGANESYLLSQEVDEIRMYIDSASNYQTTNAANLVAGTIYHVAGVYDSASQTVNLYVNGTLMASTTSGTIPSSIGDDTGEFAVGAQDTGATAANYFDGQIDDVRVYNRAFSPNEVAALYNWAPGPTIYFKLDENTGTSTVNDSSGNSYSGTLSGITADSWSQGKFGSALTLNGSSSYITAGTEDTNLSVNGYTFSAWIKRASDTGSAEIIIDNRDAADDGQLLQISSTDKFECYYNATSSVSTTSVSTNTWYHIGCSSDGTTQKLFVNGVQEDSDSLSGSIAETIDLRIGARSFTSASNYFPGTIDDVRIYSYARNSTQIVEDMNAGHPAPGSPIGSPIIQWKFDEQLESTTYNSGSGSGLNGTATGTAWRLENSTSGDCKLNGCINIDTGTDDVTLADPSFFDSITGMTATFWVNPQTLATTNAIVSKSNTSQETFLIQTDATNSDELRIYIADTLTDTSNYYVTNNLDLSAAATAANWQYIAVVYDATAPATERVKVYKNGRLAGGSVTGTIPSDGLTASSANFQVGESHKATSALLTYIDDVKIYNFALTQSQVYVDANAGSAAAMGRVLGPHDNEGFAGNPPVAWWKLDEGTGTTFYDSSGNGNTNSTWSGNTAWAPGNFGSALKFDGNDDSVKIPETTSTDVGDLTDSWTVTAWFRSATTTAFSGSIVNKRNDGTAHAPFDVTVNSSGSVGWNIRSNGGGNGSVASAAGHATPFDLKWHHVAAVRDVANDTLYIYFDGALAGSVADTVTASAKNNDGVCMGGYGDFGNCFEGDFNGDVDQVKIFNYVLSAPQVAYDFNRGGPIGWWKLDDCSGTTAGDSSAWANNGTLTPGAGTHTSAGTCNSGSASEMWDDGATGKRNYSLDFDGSDDYVTMGDDTYLDFGETSANTKRDSFSLAGWFNRETFTTDDTIVGKRAADTNGAQGYLVWVDDSTDKLTIEVCDANATCDEYMIESASTFTATGWNHFVVVWDPDSESNSTIYINGKAESVTRTGTWANISQNFSSARNFEIGAAHVTQMPFAGELDDIMVFNYVLTAQQVSNLYVTGGNALFFGPNEGHP